MSDPGPMYFKWDAERSVMVPQRRVLADRHFVDGTSYRLVIAEERSEVSHRHFFASLAEAWSNLPDRELERFPTSEHLRRYALIKTGFADEHKLICSSKAEALRVAAFMKPVDEFSLVIAKEAVVTRYTAKSQSTKAMGKEEFQRSKESVLEYCASLIGISSRELQKAESA